VIRNDKLERFWKKAAVAKFYGTIPELIGKTEEIQEKFQSGYPVSGLRFKQATS
jgi:hypothetical protein